MTSYSQITFHNRVRIKAPPDCNCKIIRFCSAHYDCNYVAKLSKYSSVIAVINHSGFVSSTCFIACWIDSIILQAECRESQTCACESAVLTAFQHNLPFQFVFVNTKSRGEIKLVSIESHGLCSKQKMI